MTQHIYLDGNFIAIEDMQNLAHLLLALWPYYCLLAAAILSCLFCRQFTKKQSARKPRRLAGKAKSNPQQLAFIQPLSLQVAAYFQYRDSQFVVEAKCEDDWLFWLKKAKACGKHVFVAMIHNRLGCMLARREQLSEAIMHFELAEELFWNPKSIEVPFAFSTQQPDLQNLSEGQAALFCLQEQCQLGFPGAAELLESSGKMLSSFRLLASSISEAFLWNRGAARIAMQAPQALGFYLQANQYYCQGDSETASLLFARAAEGFERDLKNTWYQWPLAAAYHDQVLSKVFAEGYFKEDAFLLSQAGRISRAFEEPFGGFRALIEQSLETAGAEPHHSRYEGDSNSEFMFD